MGNQRGSTMGSRRGSTMDSRHYLAIDIGASSGRHILGRLEDGIIRLEEIHRFPNGAAREGGCLCWDVDALFAEMLTGLRKCAESGKIPVSAGIDTWGVDFVLLDRDLRRIGPAVAYRDSRTDGMDAEVGRRIPESELYARTGIQKVMFNSIYQLMALKIKSPHILEGAAHLLMMPDYLHYRLSGVMKNEYTIASTSALVGAASKNWDYEVIERCGFPKEIFGEIVPAGTVLGRLAGDVRQAVGFDCAVVLPPSHDTASAFLSVPAHTENPVFISSGTWSLMGLELFDPITSEASRAANFSNEGGYGYRYRYLKNIMGLWILQSVRNELFEDIGYEELAALARESGYDGIFDVDEDRFFAPDSMAAVVREACREKGYDEPQSPGDFARCICRGLASSYSRTVDALESLTGKRLECINIIGGGSRNGFLNEATAKACGRPVYAGPAEGTALGNIVSQMIANGELSGVGAAREAIRRSFLISEVLP